MLSTRLCEEILSATSPFTWPGHRIGGAWIGKSRGDEEKTSTNPTTGEPLLTFATGQDAVLGAIRSASDSKKWFAQTDVPSRLNWLKAFRDGLEKLRSPVTKALQLEIGQTEAEARDEFVAGLSLLDLFVQRGKALHDQAIQFTKMGGDWDVQAQPMGVVAVYLPFSTPLSSFCQYLGACLLAGCPLVVFSPTQAALVGALLATVEEASGLPSGPMQVLASGFESFKRQLNHEAIEQVIYTGSREHADTIARDFKPGYRRRLFLQCGGKNAVLVHSTATLEQAVDAVALGLTKQAGQLCSSTSRVFIYRSLIEQFRKLLVKQLSEMQIGPATEASGMSALQMGPLYSSRAVEKFLRFQTMASREAEETWAWGQQVQHAKFDGYFVRPGVHLLKSLDKTSAYQNNVLFSPDLAVYTYDILDEAIDQINDTQTPFVVSFFGDPEILMTRRSILKAPIVILNKPTVDQEHLFPLAGGYGLGQFQLNGVGLFFHLVNFQAMTS